MSAPLYQMAGVYVELQRAAEEGEDVTEQLSALAGRIEDKAAALVRIERDLQLDADKLGEEVRRLTARKRAVEANRDRLRDYLRSNMDVCGIHRVKAAAFTITLGAESERVEVVDEALVPETYVRIKREVDKRAVLDAYRTTGEVVAGCNIVAGQRPLTIK